MSNQLLPERIDIAYRGHKLALWIFGLVMFMKISMSLNSIFNGSVVLSSADGIPLATYTAAAARTIVSLFALLGLSNLLICVVGILILVRYRSLIPFMYALLLLEHLSRKLILQLLPVVRTGSPPGSAINLILLSMLIIGLALSLWRRSDR